LYEYQQERNAVVVTKAGNFKAATEGQISDTGIIA